MSIVLSSPGTFPVASVASVIDPLGLASVRSHHIIDFAVPHSQQDYQPFRVVRIFSSLREQRMDDRVTVRAAGVAILILVVVVPAAHY